LARIPEDEIDRLKAEVSLQRLAEKRGIALRRHGADLLGLCPFHDDHEPSLVISPAKNLWHCLGACQAGGSVIDWVMRTEGISFRHAVELLRADLPAGTGTGSAPVRSVTRKLAPPIERDAADAEVLAQVVAYYHETLKQSPEAQAYLASRRLDSAELVARFRLGFANRTLGYRLPHSSSVSGGALRSHLTRLGVIRPSGHEHFNGSLVVPVFDEDGNVVELYGRKVTAKLRKGTPTHLYLPGPHRGVFNVEALAAGEEIILCESLIDAMTFWAAGFRHVTASYGIEGFGDEHAAAFRRHGTTRVLIAYDRDPAGDRAATALSERLMAMGIECFRVLFPAGTDANDVARNASSPTDALGAAIRAAAWMGRGPGPATLRQAAAIPAPIAPAQPQAAKEENRRGPAAGDDQNWPHPRLEPDPKAAPAPAVPSFAAQLPAEPLLASPVPPPAPAEPVAEIAGDEVTLHYGDRRWRVRGLGRVSSFEALRVNVLVSRPDPRHGQVFHVDTLDLYSARARATFTKAAAGEIGVAEEVVHRELGRVLLACEGLAEEVVRAAQAPADTTVTLSAAEEEAALELLRDPHLVERIAADFARAGVVGEATNCLLGYLAAVSRKLEAPLAVIVRSSSAAGKSSLLEAILAFVPEEDRVSYSAMTGQSLYYLGEGDLAHRVLAIAEEEGAERAAYALKLLQSEGELSIASTGKDPATGRLVTHEYRVAGPVAILTTTTAADVDEELLNRCVVLTVDEERAQTRAIHAAQRTAQTLDGLLARAERDAVLKVHRDAQRLLQPVLVVNPYATALTFADDRTRTRRDHLKYLTLIRTIALLHQHQRPRLTTTRGGAELAYIEATPADVALANRLAHEVLGRSLDELAPQTRRLLEVLDAYVTARAAEGHMERSEVRFSRRELRESCAWGDTQLKVHLARLVELEYLVVHRAERAGFSYELAWDGAGRDGSAFLVGLLDPAALDAATAYDPGRSGQNGIRSGPGRPPVGGWSGAGRTGPEPMNGQVKATITAKANGAGPERALQEHDDGAVVVEDGAERVAAEVAS
jgi:DNA primase catalytic core